jgi:hypothetical protein
LSHFLFIIVIEAFSKMLTATVDGGLFSRFSMGSRHFGVVSISHLLFVNDTLGFCGANPDHLQYACFIFMF